MEDSCPDSLRQLAPCWTLAGDEQLLNILQNTHQRIVSKCKEVSENLQTMVTSLDEASISVQNVNNRFMALSNSQFIESRVYDDDADVATEPAAVKEPPMPASLESDLQALKRSVQVLEDAHESITILQDSDTDTESEDDTPHRTVLKLKDMYKDRPLPYIIGSQAWKNKWHAGLVCSDSDSDSSVSKGARSRSEYSESEPEMPGDVTAHTAHLAVSESSSQPSEQDVLPPVGVQTTPSDIAAELARRLGGQPPKMVEQESDYEPPATTARKVYKPQQPTAGPVFSDEPPPLDASSDSADDIFAELHRSQPYSSRRDAGDLFHSHQEDQTLDPEEYEEGDIFSDFAVKPVTDPSANQGAPLFAGEPDVLADNTQHIHANKPAEDDSKGVKKPIGGISLFGTNKGTESIGAAIVNRNRRKSSTSGDDSGSDVTDTPEVPESQTKREKDIFDDLFAKSAKAQKIDKGKNKSEMVRDINKEVEKKRDVPPPKKVDLFNDNIFDDIDDIFTTKVVKVPDKNQKSIFEDDDELFSEIAVPKTVKSEVKRTDDRGLFDSDDDGLFTPKATRGAVQNIARQNEIISKIDVSNTSIIEVHRSNTEGNIEATSSTKRKNEIKGNTEFTRRKEINIFDDDNDIFSNTKTSNTTHVDSANISTKDTNKSGIVSKSDNLSKPDNLLRVDNLSKSDKKSFKSPSLFDDDDDDDLFTKPTKPSNLTQKGTAATDLLTTNKSDIFKDFEDDNLFSKPTHSDNFSQIGAAVTDKTVPVITNEGNNTINWSNERNVDGEDKNGDLKENIGEDTIIKSTIDVIKDNSSIREVSVVKDNNNSIQRDVNDNSNEKPNNLIKTNLIINKTISSDSDFEQDFDDTPPTNNNTHSITKVPESKSKIFASTENLFEKLKTVDNIDEATSTIDKSKTDIEKDLNIPDIIKGNTDIKDAADKDNNKDKIINETPKYYRDFDKIPENHSVFNEIIESYPKSDGQITETETEIDNNSIFKDIQQSTSAFDDIFSEPPAFEKPKEPKKSKNVNALFDDDSDDEALFFKKNDIIDDKPEDFTEKQDIFDIFTDVPPDEDFMNKTGSDDDLFSSLPKPKLPKNIINEVPSKNVVKIDTQIDSNEDIFKTVPKTSNLNQKLDDNDDLFKIPSVKIAPTQSKHEKSPKVEVAVAKQNETLSDDDSLFKTQPKTYKNITTQPKTDISINKTDDNSHSDEDIFKKSLKNEDINKTIPKNLTMQPQSDPVPKETTSESKDDSPKKVGKLKTMNFNINVNALLPGASPKRQKPEKITSPTDTIKHTNLDKNAEILSEAPKNITSATHIIKPTDVEKAPEASSEAPKSLENADLDIDRTDSKMVKSVSFEGEPESEILDNKLSKERAKIQVKRRPSTRRARKEAVRKSHIDFCEDSTDNSSSIDDPPRTLKDIQNIGKDLNQNLPKPNEVVVRNENSETHAENTPKIDSISTNLETNITRHPQDVKSKVVYILNDEDIFNTPVDPNPGLNTLGNIYTEPERHLNTKPDTSQNDAKFDNSKSGRIDDGNTKSVKSEGATVKKGIFDSDSDDELFITKREVKKVVKGPLFSDEDDDDLFGVRKKSFEPKPQTSRQATAREPAKPSEPVFDDPLSMLGDDD